MEQTQINAIKEYKEAYMKEVVDPVVAKQEKQAWINPQPCPYCYPRCPFCGMPLDHTHNWPEDYRWLTVDTYTTGVGTITC